MLNNLEKFQNHNLISLLLGIAFLVSMQTSASPIFSFRWLVFSFLTVFLLFWFYNRWYLKKLGKYNFWVLVRMSMLLFSGAGFFLIAPSPLFRAVFLLSAVGVITIFEIALGQFNDNLIISEILITAFGGFLGISAWALQYLPQFRIIFALPAFLWCFFLARSLFEYAPVASKTKLLAALASALLISEVFWAASFLPHHFSVIALSLTAVFYSILVLNFNFLFQNLN